MFFSSSSFHSPLKTKLLHMKVNSIVQFGRKSRQFEVHILSMERRWWRKRSSSVSIIFNSPSVFRLLFYIILSSLYTEIWIETASSSSVQFAFFFFFLFVDGIFNLSQWLWFFFLICSYFLTTSMVQSVHDVCMCVYVESAFLFQFVLKMSTGFNKMLSIFFSLYFERSLLVKREPITTKNPQRTFHSSMKTLRKKKNTSIDSHSCYNDFLLIPQAHLGSWTSVLTHVFFEKSFLVFYFFVVSNISELWLITCVLAKSLPRGIYWFRSSHISRFHRKHIIALTMWK